jgi:putative ABC transport system substrate-binding protein
MRRRTILQLAATLFAIPGMALAQAARNKARVGMLLATNPEATKHLRAAFTTRMSELGWREGSNIEYLSRYAQSDPASYGRLAAEIIARKPDVIFVGFGPFAAVVREHSRDIPIVFGISQDPVGEGLVSSLARPGGNVTGVSTRGQELVGKRLQLLKEVLPSASRIGLVRRVGTPDTYVAVSLHEELRRATSMLGLQLVEVRHEHALAGDFRVAFTRLVGERVDAIATLLSWNYPYYGDFVRHAATAKLPMIGDASEFADAGALMSFSVSYAERYRKSAEYVDRILRGAKPADLPVEEPTVFELVVNLRTARAFGVKIPQSVLLRADRVIE